MLLSDYADKVNDDRWVDANETVTHNSTSVQFKYFDSCCGITFCVVKSWKALSLKTLFERIESLKNVETYYSCIIWVGLPIEFLKERDLENNKLYSFYADYDGEFVKEVTVLENHPDYTEDYNVQDGLKSGWLAITTDQIDAIDPDYYNSFTNNLVCTFVNSKTGNDLELYVF